MKDKEFHITLKCLFCGCELKDEIEKEHHSGDILECQECGEMNDYDSLVEVAIEEGNACVKKYAHDEMAKILKNTFK